MNTTAGPNGRDDAAIDESARSEFLERYGDVALGPVCIVIAAYREASSIATSG